MCVHPRKILKFHIMIPAECFVRHEYQPNGCSDGNASWFSFCHLLNTVTRREILTYSANLLQWHLVHHRKSICIVLGFKSEVCSEVPEENCLKYVTNPGNIKYNESFTCNV
jgi:hypothetical protein